MITDADNAYIYGPDGLPLEQIGPTGTVRYFSHDQLGSTTQLTNASGVVVQSYAYDAHGQRTSSAPTVPNPFQYAGQYTDATTGLQYLRARYHDPTTSQFLSPDPLQDTTGQPYSYANNDPINNTDPTGQSSASDLSDTAAGLLHGLTFGESTKLAGSLFHFDANCTDFGSWFGVGRAAGLVGSLFGGEVATLGVRGVRGVRGIRAAAEDEGALSRLGRKLADERGSVGRSEAGDIGFGHGARHLAGTGLSRGRVETAIEEQVRRSTAGATVSGSVGGRLSLGGRTIEYRGYGLPDGRINIGTYYTVP
jgi:RHS repeat-associated protein